MNIDSHDVKVSDVTATLMVWERGLREFVDMKFQVTILICVNENSCDKTFQLFILN